MSISPPAMGLQESFGIARESSYGSAVDPTIWFKPSTNTLTRTDPHLPMAGPTGAMVQHRYHATRPRKFQGTPTIGGTVAVEAEFDDIGHLFSNAIATPSFDDDAPVAGAHTHVWAVTAAKPAATPISLSAGCLTGLEDLRYAGVMINNLELRGSPGQIVVCSMDLIGQSGGDAEVPDDDTEGYSTAPWMEFHHSQVRYHATPATATGSLATLASGSEAADWTCRLENNYRQAQAAGNGIRGIREPVWDGYRMASVSFNRDLFDDEFFDEYHAAGVATAFSTIEVRLQTTELIGATATPYELRWYMPYALLDRESTYGGGAGIRPERVTFMAGTDGSAAPLTVTLINGTGTTPYGS